MASLRHFESWRTPKELVNAYPEAAIVLSTRPEDASVLGQVDDVYTLGENTKFLEWEEKDGWGPLCEFLTVPVPAQHPSPWHDDWISYEEKAEEQTGNQLV